MSNDTRAAFEAFAISKYKQISLERDGDVYRYALASTQWEFWQASRNVAIEDAANWMTRRSETHHYMRECVKLMKKELK